LAANRMISARVCWPVRHRSPNGKGC